MIRADVPTYTHVNACPWSGVACECATFPWLDGKSQLPEGCGKLIRDKMPVMIEFRKIPK
jgi:hypothetical protein